MQSSTIGNCLYKMFIFQLLETKNVVNKLNRNYQAPYSAPNPRNKLKKIYMPFKTSKI